MLTAQQEKEVAQYLISKRLSADLFIEIKDHFITQISNLIDEKNLSFQEAFLQARLTWKYELEMTKADIFSFRKISRIEKETLQMRFRNITLYALISSFILSCLLFLSSELFMYMQILLLAVFGILLIYNLILRKMKLYHYIQLSFHPLILKNALAGILIFSTVYFFSDFTIAQSGIMKLFFLYVMTAKIQLLYFRSKNTNVLI